MSDDPDHTLPEDAADGGAAGGDSSPKKMPEGMRVVRKRRKKRNAARQTLFLKKREILREMHEDGGAVGVKEQVERLKSARKAKQEGRPMEDHWGGPVTRHRGARWMLLRAFAIMIPILAIVTAFLLTKGEGGDKPIAYDPELDLGKSEPDEIKLPYDPSGPIAWFNEHPHEAYQSAVGILEQLNELEPGASPRSLLRDEELVLPKVAKRGIGWASDFRTDDQRGLLWSTQQFGDTGFIVVEGSLEDRGKFRSYFVKTPEGLRLDWEASTGWSDFTFDEFLKDPPSEPFMVRCHLIKEPHFDTESGPASLYSWYLIRSADENQHAWGYLPQGSALDKELLDLFRFGWVVLDRRESVRVTLRLSRSQIGTRPGEFEIEKLLTEEWVLP